MIKLVDILLNEDLPKGKWVDLDNKKTKEYAEDIFNLINTAYTSIGGHSNYKSSNDVVGAESDADYEVINLDDDSEIDAVSVSKKNWQEINLLQLGMTILHQLNRQL